MTTNQTVNTMRGVIDKLAIKINTLAQAEVVNSASAYHNKDVQKGEYHFGLYHGYLRASDWVAEAGDKLEAELREAAIAVARG